MIIAMNIAIQKEINMIKKKIKCVHCSDEIMLDEFSSDIVSCTCGAIKSSGDIITEGVVGDDWIDVSPKLLNE